MWSVNICLCCTNLPKAGAYGTNSCTFSAVRFLLGRLAQLVEHHNGIVGVIGSNPLASTNSPFEVNLLAPLTSSLMQLR